MKGTFSGCLEMIILVPKNISNDSTLIETREVIGLDLDNEKIETGTLMRFHSSINDYSAALEG